MKKLNLGKELSKNEQKKVIGGVWVTCHAAWGGTITVWLSSCSQGEAYCNGAHNGFISCSGPGT